MSLAIELNVVSSHLICFNLILLMQCITEAKMRADDKDDDSDE